MTDIISIGSIGMTNDLYQMDIISHNLANSQTPGYKRDIAVARGFDAMMNGEMSPPATGVGYLLDAPTVTTLVDRSAGSFSNTGNPLDFAIEGDGFFEVAGPEGIRYTRQGDFKLDAAGQLATTSGYVVNGLAGDIRLTTAAPRVDETGKIWDGENLLGQVKVVNFADATRLIKEGNGLYQSYGDPILVETGGQLRVRQGYLENSNVSELQEMVRLISTVRHFEATQRMVKGADEMLGEAIDTIAKF